MKVDIPKEILDTNLTLGAKLIYGTVKENEDMLRLLRLRIGLRLGANSDHFNLKLKFLRQMVI